jgi:hypothetical protein
MLFIWFYRVRDFIIAVLIAVVSLLTSECMSEFSLLFIVSVIKIALALLCCLNSLIVHIFQGMETACSLSYLIKISDCRVLNTEYRLHIVNDNVCGLRGTHC